ncbi:MAG: hypothetical protein SGJ20_04320 [Planctomycetota bacterium]|nr:hypothetical protein [Planctomycetota bacterium]
MSTFENDNYKWRETYFVLFDSSRRPALDKLTKSLTRLNPRFELVNPTEDIDGRFESVTIRSPQDYAALDISYLSGEEVNEQGVELSLEMKPYATEPDEKQKLARLPECDARLDILHFEQLGASTANEPEDDAMLDPGALLLVLDALVDLTGGVGVDPQSGTIV